MFCVKCGAMLDDGQRFCTRCGAATNELASVEAAPTQSVRFGDVRHVETVALPGEGNGKPAKAKRGKALPVAIIVALLFAVAVGAAAVFTLGYTAPVEVRYASDAKVRVTGESVIVAYDASGEPLEDYEVSLEPIDVAEELDWAEVAVSVSGTSGFSLDDFSYIPRGTYALGITDTESGDEYRCPQIELVEDGEAAEKVLLKVDPDDPEAATAAPPAVFGYEYDTTEVEFSFNDGVTNESVESLWVCPQFTSTQESAALDALNTSLRTAFDEELQEAKEWTLMSSTQGQCTLLQGEVVYLAESMASVRFERYRTNWGPHGQTEVTGAVYDLETGQQVSPESVFGMTADELEQAAQEAIEAYLQNNPSDLFEADELESAIRSIVSDRNRYYVSEVGLVVSTWAYELGSFAYGGREIVVAAFEDDALVGFGAEV